jgi:hypothetical protein
MQSTDDMACTSLSVGVIAGNRIDFDSSRMALTFVKAALVVAELFAV